MSFKNFKKLLKKENIYKDSNGMETSSQLSSYFNKTHILILVHTVRKSPKICEKMRTGYKFANFNSKPS